MVLKAQELQITPSPILVCANTFCHQLGIVIIGHHLRPRFLSALVTDQLDFDLLFEVNFLTSLTHAKLLKKIMLADLAKCQGEVTHLTPVCH